MAHLIRRSLHFFLHQQKADRAELYARGAALVGAFKDREEATDVSVDHDRYLGEAFR